MEYYKKARDTEAKESAKLSEANSKLKEENSRLKKEGKDTREENKRLKEENKKLSKRPVGNMASTQTHTETLRWVR